MREWFKPPSDLNGWGYQTEQRLDTLEALTADLPKDRRRLDRLERSSRGPSSRSLLDWLQANQRKLILYAAAILLLTGKLTVADVKDRLGVELPFIGSLLGGAASKP